MLALGGRRWEPEWNPDVPARVFAPERVQLFRIEVRMIREHPPLVDDQQVSFHRRQDVRVLVATERDERSPRPIWARWWQIVGEAVGRRNTVG
jgi:hypothetical protein